MTHQAQDGERCMGNQRADLKVLEDKGKLGLKPTGVAQGAGSLIIVRLNPDAFLFFFPR